MVLGSLLHSSNTADTYAKLELARKQKTGVEMNAIEPVSEDVEKCVTLLAA
jgi:hypothetical protein